MYEVKENSNLMNAPFNLLNTERICWMSKYLATILSASQLLSHLEQRKRQLMKKETKSNPMSVLISLL